MFDEFNKSARQLVDEGHMPPGMFDMMTGGNMPDPMFKRIPSMGTGNEPTPEDVEEAAEKARYTKELYITRVCVKNFNLSDEKQAQDYCSLYQQLYNEVRLKTVYIKDVHKEFINHPGTDPYYMVHMEWWEYEMRKHDHADPDAPDLVLTAKVDVDGVEEAITEEQPEPTNA